MRRSCRVCHRADFAPPSPLSAVRFHHFTCDVPAIASCSLQSGVRRARSSGRGEPMHRAAGTSPFSSRNHSKRPVNSSSEQPFAVSVTPPARHKIKRQFSRTLHRNIEDLVSTLGSSNKTKVRFVLTAICCFSPGKAARGDSSLPGIPVSRAPLWTSCREGSMGLAQAWGRARLRTGATLNRGRAGGKRSRNYGCHWEIIEVRRALSGNLNYGEISLK